MATIREWRSNDWDKSNKGRDQWELKRMAKEILTDADDIEDTPTPGHSKDELSRVMVAKSSIFPNRKYIIHVNGFTVNDITEIYYSNEELERLKKLA